MSDDFFAELEAEIKQATAKSALKADAVKLRQKSNNMRLSPAERQRASLEFKELQSIIEVAEWRPVAVAALFTEQHCDGCDTIHHTFLQYMLKEVKIRTPTTSRWVRLLVPELNGLPRETIVQPIVTHVCAACCADHGFLVDAPTIRLLPSHGTLTVSPTYNQGDINDQAPEEVKPVLY